MRARCTAWQEALGVVVKALAAVPRVTGGKRKFVCARRPRAVARRVFGGGELRARGGGPEAGDPDLRPAAGRRPLGDRGRGF